MKTITYSDKNDVDVNIGDILYYDEGGNYAKGIHEVIERDGKLYGKSHLYDNPEKDGATPSEEDIVSLEFYCSLSYLGILCDATIIGNIKNNPEMLTIEWATKNKPLRGGWYE